MHDPLLRHEIEDFYLYLQKVLRADRLTIPSSNYDLVLDIVPVGDKIQWGYYYACHEKRCLFWLETYDATYTLSEAYGVKSPAHLSALHMSSPGRSLSSSIGRAGHRLEAFFWSVRYLLLGWYPKHHSHFARNHWSLFPTVFEGRRLPLPVYDELMGILLHGCVGEFVGLSLGLDDKR
jgi:hypothetical protein